jgi:hypothetical protein
LACALFILFLVIIFGGLVHHFSHIVFGAKLPEGSEGTGLVSGEVNHWTVSALWIPLIFIAIMGLTIPSPLQTLLLEATKIVVQERQLPGPLGTIAGTY